MGAHGVHDWRPRGDGAAAQIIAIRKAAWKHRKIGGRAGCARRARRWKVSLRDFPGRGRVLFTIRAGERIMAAFMCRLYFPRSYLHVRATSRSRKSIKFPPGNFQRPGWRAISRMHRAAIFPPRLIVCCKFDLEYFSLPHAVDPIDTERFERALDGLALRIQNTVLECDNHPRFHRSDLWLMAWAGSRHGDTVPQGAMAKARQGR